MLKIKLSGIDVNIPKDIIGIDMGHSLTKIVFMEENEINLFIYSTQKNNTEITNLLETKKEIYKKYNFSGGKSFSFYNYYSTQLKAKLIDEFEAISKGVELLYFLERKKELSNSLIVTIGTGTSIILKNEEILHLGGSALGGGFFMGFIKYLFNINDFNEAISLAKQGNRYNVDLKVSDIYDPQDNRVDSLFREFTAASLGKINESSNLNSLNRKDFINSIICMLGENLGIIATLMADNHKVENILYGGGFLKDNKVLKKILSILSIVNKKKAIFLNNSEYCAALGALMS